MLQIFFHNSGPEGDIKCFTAESFDYLINYRQDVSTLGLWSSFRPTQSYVEHF